ncbi:MAG: DUF4912 domain-containing protein [Vicinamibacteria bacterium]|nr:DUF4912 domain-containing protein [Vicinamibacteria bacterium]
MRKPTGVAVVRKKVAAKRTAAKTPSKKAAPLKPRVRVARTIEKPPPPKAKGQVEAFLSEAQTQVEAAKFVGSQTPPARRQRSLPSTYGESHMLLLARDPKTLFAAWDMSPSVTETLKARIGQRGFAVSTLTLRLTPAGGRPSVFHVGKRTRSRYLRIAGGSSFVAEIGFTTPEGRFEFVARSAPCLVSMSGNAPAGMGGTTGRLLLRYRDALGLTRQGIALSTRSQVAAPGTVRSKRDGLTPPEISRNSSVSRPSTARVLGGASDLYRR